MGVVLVSVEKRRESTNRVSFWESVGRMIHVQRCACEPIRSSEQGRTVDALARTGEEGRDKLRKASGSRT